MTRPVHFLPEAERELVDAFAWYERQRRGLGLEFLLAFDAAIEKLRRIPDGHELVASRTRKALLRRFPYLVLYVVEAERVVDELVILERGCVVAAGSPTSLRASIDADLRLEVSLNPDGIDPTEDSTPFAVSRRVRIGRRVRQLIRREEANNG